MTLDNARLRGSVSLTSDITIDFTESRATGKIHVTLEPIYTYRTIDHKKMPNLEATRSKNFDSLRYFF